MNISNEEIKKFCSNYSASVKQDPRGLKVPEFVRPSDYIVDLVTSSMIDRSFLITRDVPVYDIKITEGGFSALLDIDKKILEYQRTCNNLSNALNQRKDKDLQECIIRESNPAVKKAYEHYQILFEIAKAEYNDRRRY